MIQERWGWRKGEQMSADILVVGEEGSILNLWYPKLARKGYQTLLTDWDSAPEQARQASPSLIILDSVRPPHTCLAQCQLLRRVSGAMILLLSNQDANEVQELGIELWPRPLRLESLVRHIKKMLQANDSALATPRILQIGEISLDVERRMLIKGATEYALPPKQFALLQIFMNRPGQIISRRELMKAIWETDYLGDTRTLYVHIRWLRKMIEKNPAAPAYLRTVRGVGYRFSSPE
jgi:DNA-binding response OmpR family regulator